MDDLYLTISEIQEYGSEMLRVVASICEKNSVKWFMAYGSMLGAIRHHGPIPWDYDIDIYVPESELPVFLQVMERELPPKYWIDYRNNTKHDRAFPRIGLRGYETEILHIDVYRLGGLPDDPKEYKRFTKYSRLLFVTWKSKTLDINYYYPDKKRRLISKTVKGLTWFIPLKTVLKLIDKQVGRIPMDKATIVASPLTTRSRKRMHDPLVFSESILVKYSDFFVRVPRDYEKYLTVQFGNWKAYPPLEERELALKKTFIIRTLGES